VRLEFTNRAAELAELTAQGRSGGLVAVFGRRPHLLDDHTASVFEDQMRARWPGAARYWEADVELDLVRPEREGLVVAEVEWTRLTRAEGISVAACC
jgi:hypothetical protein